ncbi:MAG TPA: hypothetical protein DDW81_13490 [Cryomorphaceae bacterium]|nr:hypothetical protein [Cryomorphaceae bacterium]
MKVSGGMRIRNARTGSSGTLGIVVLRGQQKVGLTNHHVLYGFNTDPVKGQFGDRVEVETAPGQFSYLGTVGDTSEAIDASLVHIDENSGLDVQVYKVENYAIGKLDSSKLSKGLPVYKKGSSSLWTQAVVQGYKKGPVTLRGVPNVSLPGDSGTVWLDWIPPCTVHALHYWGNNEGSVAWGVNIAKVVAAFGLNPKAP